MSRSVRSSRAMQDVIGLLQSCSARLSGVPRALLVLLGQVHLHETVAGRLQIAGGRLLVARLQLNGRGSAPAAH
jgi:hypothetical protein